MWDFDISNPEAMDREEFHKPYYFLLNMAVGGTFTGIYDRNLIAAPLPADLVIEFEFTTLGTLLWEAPESFRVVIKDNA